MYEFQNQDSAQTLREAIAEFREANPAVAAQRSASAAGAAFFRSHDACHVLFGLDTSLRQEALVDTWMLCGTTATSADFIRYMRLAEHQEIIEKIGPLPLVKTVIASLPDVIRILLHSRKMPGKWPWDDFDSYLDIPLNELRRRFSIRLVGV